MAVTTCNGGVASGATVTANASANTYGGWTELHASTPEAAFGLTLSFIWGNGGGRQFLVDIGVGGSGSEVAVIAQIPLSRPGIDWVEPSHSVYIPISIPAGSRLVARCQSSLGSAALNFTAYLLGGTGAGTTNTYGAVPASSRGTEVDCGAVVNTKGAWAVLTTSTSQAHTGLTVITTLGTNGSPDFLTFIIDISIGSAGNEASNILIADLISATNQSAEMTPGSWFFPVSIPSGSRISVRAQCGVTDATDRKFDIAVIGSTFPVGSGGGGETSHPFIG